MCQILYKNPSSTHRARVKGEVKGQMRADHLNAQIFKNVSKFLVFFKFQTMKITYIKIASNLDGPL